MPYIPNPLSHASFKDVFTYEWLQDLKGKLRNFLNEIGSHEHLPVIFQMFNSYKKDMSGELNSENQGKSGGDYAKIITQLEANNEKLLNALQESNEKYDNLEKNFEYSKRNEEIVRSSLFESNVKWISFMKEVIILNKEVNFSKNKLLV